MGGVNPPPDPPPLISNTAYDPGCIGPELWRRNEQPWRPLLELPCDLARFSAIFGECDENADHRPKERDRLMYLVGR